MKQKRRRVVVESPFAGDRERNGAYLRAAMKDCIARGEAPFASHLLYTQFLDDDVPEERAAGMESGFAWGNAAEACVVYSDFGVSSGMAEGIKLAKERGQLIEPRTLPEWRPVGAPRDPAETDNVQQLLNTTGRDKYDLRIDSDGSVTIWHEYMEVRATGSDLLEAATKLRPLMDEWRERMGRAMPAGGRS